MEEYIVEAAKMIINIGDKVTFSTFDGPIDVTVTEIQELLIVGVTETGERHWCPVKDVIKQ